MKPKQNADLTDLHAALGTAVLSSYPAIGNMQTVKLPPGTTVQEMLALFQLSGLVQYAEPDWIVRALNEPNDPDYTDGLLWNFNNTGQSGGTAGADIKAPAAWDIRTNAGDIIVAVIDTGVNYTHEDLGVPTIYSPTGNMWRDTDGSYGINTVNNGRPANDPWDDHGHGTHVAGIIGAIGDNSTGIVGVAWRVKIMACKFLSSDGNGPVSDAIACIDYARTKGAKIINASWGDYFQYPFNWILPDFHEDAGASQALWDAINRAKGDGIIFVAACGNNGNNNDSHPLYPASYSKDNNHGGQSLPALDNVIAVAATDKNDSLAIFPSQVPPNDPGFPGVYSSNYGATSVHLGAPGGGSDLLIRSAWNGANNDYADKWGTSMAAPHVAGACALVWAQYPDETHQQIIHRVLVSTDSLPSLAGKCRTGGRLNLHKALTVPGAWQQTDRMWTRRYGHTATLLHNGTVLVAGGFNSVGGVLRTAEVYNPATGTWANTFLMTTARYLHTATLLNDGRVLVAGGYGNLPSAELYDPATATWTATGNSMDTGRELHTATRLPSGNVLVAGGHGVFWPFYLPSAELYNSISGWSAANPLNIGRKQHTATLLGSGAVLAAGGDQANALASAELYANGAWTATGSMNVARQNHTATLLNDGRVLVAGGDQIAEGPGELVHSSAELYQAGTWTPTSPMKAARTYHTATLLSDGKVLVAGGNDTSSVSSEFYSAGAWTTTGAMVTARAHHTATLLPSGKVLVAGGCELLEAEVFVP